jgi:DNA-binding response OmpR family regulator
VSDRAYRILVVEDDPTIAGAVTARLQSEGFSTETARDGPGAVERFAADPPDLVLLDIMLPGFDGLEVCRRIQARRHVPVLMLTARDDEVDQLIGLGVGADDYLTKPFSMRVLVARVRALLRRTSGGGQGSGGPGSGGSGDRVLRFGPGSRPVELDIPARRVRAGGVEVHLTPTEFDLLCCLAVAPGTVFTRPVLLERVWNWANASTDAPPTRVVDSHVKALRRKLGPDLIRTVHGVGYALEVPT